VEDSSNVKGAGLCDYAIFVAILLVICDLIPIKEKTASTEGCCAFHVEFESGNLADAIT
jgi:hypothetical protein